MLAEYYKATDRQLWYESNRGNEVKNYAKIHKKTRYLNYETNIDDTKELSIKKIQHYGISLGSDTRKLAAVKYLRDWLYTVRNNKDGIKIYNYNLIYDIRLLRELLRWNMDKNSNFDGVSAMLILSFLEKDIKVNNNYSNLSSKDFGILSPDILLENI